MNINVRLRSASPIRLRFQPGATGPAGDVTIGTTTTGAPGSSASVVNSGTPQHAILDFTVPQGPQGEKGDKGDKGDQGDQGPSGSVTDGDKGDIIVSGAGTVWTVDSAVIAPYLKRDGTSTITADIPFGGKKITGLADATAATDALNRQTGDARYRLASDAGWKKVSDINVGTAVATVDVALPSGWKALKIAGVWIPDQVVSDNTLGIRFSVDNGATYKAGASDYIGSTLSQSGSTPGAAGSVAGTYWRAGTATDNSTVVCAFHGLVTQSSGSKIPSMLGFSTGYSSGGTTLIYRGGYCNFGGITNIRFLPANGNIGVGTRLVLEVCF